MTNSFAFKICRFGNMLPDSVRLCLIWRTNWTNGAFIALLKSRAATLSITNNIAEGSGSVSDIDFANFLNTARRSTFEVANVISCSVTVAIHKGSTPQKFSWARRRKQNVARVHQNAKAREVAILLSRLAAPCSPLLATSYCPDRGGVLRAGVFRPEGF